MSGLDPFNVCAGPAGLIDRMIGEQYNVVKIVSDNMAIITALTTPVDGVTPVQVIQNAISAAADVTTGLAAVASDLAAANADVTAAALSSTSAGTSAAQAANSAAVAGVAAGQALAAASTETILGRNRIINGDMRINQRGTGASGTAIGYMIDRWVYGTAQALKITWGPNLNAAAPPAGYTKYLGVQSSSAYAVLPGDYFYLGQALEGVNAADLGWGTAVAQSVTLSFWAYSSLTGTFGGAIVNGAGVRSYPFTYTIPTANTWTRITIIIPGDTSGVWPTDNTQWGTVRFSLGAGSSLSAAAGAWKAGVFVSATGAVSVVGTNAATLYVTGVQLESGSVATPFERRLYAQELQLCQRYYQFANDLIVGGYNIATNTVFMTYPWPVQMRGTPTISLTESYANATGLAVQAGTNSQHIVLGVAIITTGYGYAQAAYTADAEL